MQLKKSIEVGELLSLIPEDALSCIARDTRIDYCSKVLYGRSVFYLLLYSILFSERNSLRTMEDIFNNKKFKLLFHLDLNKKVSHSSISERLSVINVDYFERLFNLFYDKLSTLYTNEEILRQHIIRVDSTMVSETCNKLKAGMVVGRKKDGKKQIKYSIAFDGLLPCDVKVFNTQQCLSEDLTLPEVVYKYSDKKRGKIFVFDRGVNKRITFEKMSIENIEFVSRLNPESRYKEVRMIEQGGGRRVGSLYLISEQEIKLYKNGPRQLTDETYRLIKAGNESGEQYWFLTNVFDIETEVILLYYRKRWDIEVFFRFLKQELNFSHFFSTSENGIKVILYMTLITSMLLLIYKRINKIGYKTAKRRFMMQLDDIIIEMAIQQYIRNINMQRQEDG